MKVKKMQDALVYPFDAAFILRKKKAIKAELLLKSDLKDLNVAILGGSTTAEIKDILELFLLKSGIKPNFYESEFNRYYEDAMFKNEKLINFKPDVIYMHTTSINIVGSPKFTDSNEEIKQKLSNELTKFKSMWKEIRDTYHCPIIQNNFELPFTRSLGNLDFSNVRGQINFIMRLNLAFA
jgi:predicted enzyme involved in methoxymalonyl-ACP biosynthesis